MGFKNKKVVWRTNPSIAPIPSCIVLYVLEKDPNFLVTNMLNIFCVPLNF